MKLKDYKKNLRDFLLKEYDTAIKKYEEHNLVDYEEDYYRGQIIIVEDILNYCFGLHKEYFD